MLIHLPGSWPTPLVGAFAMVALASVDLLASITAKEAVVRRSAPLALVGAGLFLLLFWVYVSSLQYAELAPVTFGWIVVLQIGVLLVDRYRYGAHLPRGAWFAILLMIVTQGYLMHASDTTGPHQEPPPRAPLSNSPMSGQSPS